MGKVKEYYTHLEEDDDGYEDYLAWQAELEINRNLFSLKILIFNTVICCIIAIWLL